MLNNTTLAGLDNIDNIQLRSTRALVNLDILEQNIKMIKEMAGSSVDIMAVIKANGYGHGAVEIAPTLMKGGASYLAVATLSEALKLRKAYDSHPILILGHTPDRYLSYVVDNNIAQTVFSYSQAALLSQLAIKARKKAVIHIKADTGFHRLGVDAADINSAAAEIRKICDLPDICAEGIFSHLALVSDEENSKQFDLFIQLVKILESEGKTFKYVHIADSIAAVDFPMYRLNMVRTGALMYGMRGFHKGMLPVEQAFTLKTAISQLHTVRCGEGVGYDYLWKAPCDSVIATLPFGYADGYPRNMRGKGYVTINQIKCPIVGVICMDQCMADVTHVPGVHQGQDAVIYGTGINEMTIAEAALLAETNKNDILSRITTRVPRFYYHSVSGFST